MLNLAIFAHHIGTLHRADAGDRFRLTPVEGLTVTVWVTKANGTLQYTFYPHTEGSPDPDTVVPLPEDPHQRVWVGNVWGATEMFAQIVTDFLTHIEDETALQLIPRSLVSPDSVHPDEDAFTWHAPFTVNSDVWTLIALRDTKGEELPTVPTGVYFATIGDEEVYLRQATQLGRPGPDREYVLSRTLWNTVSMDPNDRRIVCWSNKGM